MRAQLQVVQGRGMPRALELEAPSLDAARALALKQGFAVLSCRAVRSWPIGLERLGRKGASNFDVLVFVDQLRDLLSAGLSVMEALDALRRGVSEAGAQPIARLERALQEGRTLSAAFAEDAATYPELLTALVRAAELTSDLPAALGRFLEHEQRAAEVRHRLAASAIYPAMLIGVGALVLLFLLFYVMPRFARVFEGMTGDLPWSARAMVVWSQWLHANSQLALLAAAGTALVLAASALSQSTRAAVLRAVLNIAPLQRRLRTYWLSRWYRSTGMLVQGGIPLSQALPLSLGVLPTLLQAQASEVAQAVHDGLAPAAAYARAGMVTPVAEQLLLAGERTGDLGSVLTRIAQYHEADVSRTLERTMRALEPVVMVCVGVGVGLIVVLMYLPIFELAAAIR